MICKIAGITQLAECQICNLNVVGATPTTGFMLPSSTMVLQRILVPSFIVGSNPTWALKKYYQSGGMVNALDC